jgi:c-di-GMP-related signal transduction protein
MGFARSPLWDSRRGLAGFWLATDEPLDDALETHPSIWLSLALLGWDFPGPRKGLRLWALSPLQWSQALELRTRQPDSFAQWASHLAACGAWVGAPRALGPQLESSLALVEALAERGAPTFCADFFMDAPSIALASRGAGAVLDVERLGEQAVGALSERFSKAGKTALVRGVSTPEQARALAEHGAGPFLGFGLWARGAGPQAARLDPILEKALAALALTFSDADAFELEEAFHADPPLAYRLIHLANSAALGRPGARASSARQALMVLGRAQLAQWLCSIIAMPHGAKPDHGAARWALCARAKLCELLANASPKTQGLGSQAFACGVFSGLPALLDCAGETLQEACPLPEPLACAVSKGAGPLGSILALALACESPQGLGPRAVSQAQELGLDPAALDAPRLQAFNWACSQAS